MLKIRPMRTVLSLENLQYMGIPKRLQGLTIKDFLTYDNKSLEEVKDYIKNYISIIQIKFEENKGICLYGANGVGKTMIACIIIKEAYRNRYTARRVTFVEYVAEYTRIWGANNPDTKEMLEDAFYTKYKAVEFLVLEELGKEIDSKIVAPILEDLLRYREDKGLVTIFCTNITPSEIKERYGNSTFSLMQGNMTPIKIEGVDKRKTTFDDKKGGAK